MMQGTYYKEWSSVLNREMEFKVYGSAGVPVLALPARGGRFFDWENNGMPDAIAQLLNEGKIQLFCADSMDGEGVLNGGSAAAPPGRDAQEKYFVYLTAELAPRILTPEQGRKGHQDLVRWWGSGRLSGRELPPAPPQLFCRCRGHGRHLRPEPLLGC